MSAPKQGPFILVASYVTTLTSSIVGKGMSEADELEKLLLAVTKKATTEEPGTLTYRLSRDTSDRTKFIVYGTYLRLTAEEYKDEAAFDAHRASDEFQTLFRQVEALTARFDFQFLHELHP